MPRLIFKCPYIKGGTSSATAHLENYVKYMATRNGVERIDPGRSEWPATSKQKKMVEQILRDFPLSRGMFEYEDYAAEPTRTNASEFITRALEDNYNQIAKKDNYLKYIATRPRAQRVGSHGLFTGEEDQLVLAQVAEAVAAHPGNVWLPIISLRREDAARLGYDKAEEWKALLSEYAMEMAEAMKIPWEDFRWYAAFHDEAHHPHIHMVCYSADPSKGFLTTQGIAQIKSGLAKEIFRQELTELYQQQTQSRDTLNEDARSMLEQLIEQMWSGAVVNHRMEKLMEHLAERLRHTGGRKQYGYLKAPLKAVVDEIVDELAKEPCVAAAYALWYELREDVLRTYKDDLPPRLPLSQQKAFKRIKNIVIEEAVTLGARQQVFHPDDQQDRVPVEDQEEAPLPEAPQPDNDWNDFSESPPDDVPDKTVSAPAKAQMNWSDEYRLARRCLFGGKDQPQDLEQAFTLFQQEAQKGNALAMHDLGRMLADGLGRKIDMQAAHVWYSKALAAFYAVERQKKKRYAEYRIGKLYAAGLGCEQDYGDAARWFQLSADKGYKYAQYSLAGLFRRGQGVEQDDARALELYTASAQQDFPYAAYELGKMYRDGIGCEKDAEASEQWYRQAFAGFLELEQQSHDDKLQYRIGWMLLHGVGTGKDETAAREWFEQASKLDNPHAQYQLARMIFNDPSSTPEQTAQALERLTKAAEAGQDCAQYALGKIYRDGQGVEKDIQKAVARFTLAATKENSFAAFALGKLYLAGDAALPRDPAAALKWLTYAAELGNQFAQYRLGKLLLKGDDGIPKDVITAIRWLTAAAKQENGYAEYALALVYLTGEDAPKDSVKALSLLKRSAGRGNQFAQYRLGKLLLQGEDAPKDVKAAIRWLTAAAEQGNQYAQYALGKLYLSDDPEVHDPDNGIQWLERAAQKGNADAAYRLGKEYLTGTSVQKNAVKAAEYLRHAADRNHPWASYLLGKLYLTGNGIPKDEETAWNCFRMANAYGHPYARYVLERQEQWQRPELLLTVSRLLYHMSNIFRDNAPAVPAQPRLHIDRKRMQELQEMRIALGHQPDDHEEEQTQTWGGMTMKGW